MRRLPTGGYDVHRSDLIKGIGYEDNGVRRFGEKRRCVFEVEG
jgi:hypothetical protein